MIINREDRRIREDSAIRLERYKNSQNMPHWHYECELLYVDKGGLDVMCNQNRYRIAAGQTFFIDGKSIHSMNALSPDTEVTMIVFDPYILGFSDGGLTPENPALENNYDIPALYLRLKDEYLQKRQFYRRRMTAELTVALIDILRAEKLTERKPTVNTAERVIDLMEDVSLNCDSYDFERAAAFMNMNPSYFSRLFHRLTGITFSQYLNFARCERAVNLLNGKTRLTMTEIADRCGFMTIRNFNRIFKSVTSFSPSSLPQGFALTNRYDTLNEASRNPTLNECLLLESFGA